MINKTRLNIWIDVVTPADVRLFNCIIKDNPDHNYIVTTRNGKYYNELIDLLNLFNIKYTIIGNYGIDKYDKLIQHASRVKKLAEFIKDKNIDLSIGLIAVDQARVAYGLGIKHYEINDMPYIGANLTPQTKLTALISDKFIVPFYSKFNTEYKIDFLIQLLHLDAYKNEIPNIKDKKNIIVIRDAEYFASYNNFDKSNNKEFHILDILYNTFFNKYDYIYIPRYKQNIKELRKKYKHAIIYDKAQDIIDLYKQTKFFIGGGGTMNIEALYFNANVISTRKFMTEYDEYLKTSIHYTQDINVILDIIQNNKMLNNILRTMHVNKKQLYQFLDLL